MREPNLGISMSCSVCGKMFWCDDGISVCSSACDESVTCECGNDKERYEDCCTDCGTCPECGEYKEQEDLYCEGEYCLKEGA